MRGLRSCGCGSPIIPTLRYDAWVPLSRSERFKLKSQLIREIDQQADWDLRRQNLLLAEFGLETIDGGWDGSEFGHAIARLNDSDLIEMFAVVAGMEEEEVSDVFQASDEGNWKNGYVRLFISHSAGHKAFVGEVADELAVVGIHGFVAHDTMEVSKPWQGQIEEALRSMQAFVAIVHPEFNNSAWCQQEVGWALGRRVPKFAVRMGSDPVGFIGSDQWHSAASVDAKGVAKLIMHWMSGIPELGERMVEGLLAALEVANNYMDAGATANRLATLSGLSPEQWNRLDEIYWKNDQLFTGALPTKALRPFYEHNGRAWPPTRTVVSSAPTDQATSSGHEEPPS